MSKGIAPERCGFRLISYGPILDEVATAEEHRGPRDITAALEKALATAMREAGYNVINIVNCRMPLDGRLFADCRAAFADEFPKLTGTGES
jgi:hypothetical protein